jgi:hypothetical protein
MDQLSMDIRYSIRTLRGIAPPIGASHGLPAPRLIGGVCVTIPPYSLHAATISCRGSFSPDMLVCDIVRTALIAKRPVAVTW